MRQIVVIGDGGVDKLRIQRVPDPLPAPNEVIIDVHAAGLNFADVLAVEGIYQDAPKKPCVLGYEVSGIISDVGRNIDPKWIDRPVVALTRFGGQAEKVAVPIDQVFGKPDKLTYEQAAVLPVNYLTAYALVVVMGGLTDDETILIQNAGGGVGLAAVDIAHHIGAIIYGTASSHKHQFLRNRGVDYAIDYHRKDWISGIKRLTGGKGVELILDATGGSQWRNCYKLLRPTGRLGIYGISEASSKSSLRAKVRLLRTVLAMPRFHPVSLMQQNKGVFGLNLGHLWDEGQKIRGWMRVIYEGIEEGWIRPQVDKVFEFEDADRAYQYLSEGRNIGKVVLVP